MYNDMFSTPSSQSVIWILISIHIDFYIYCSNKSKIHLLMQYAKQTIKIWCGLRRASYVSWVGVCYGSVRSCCVFSCLLVDPILQDGSLMPNTSIFFLPYFLTFSSFLTFTLSFGQWKGKSHTHTLARPLLAGVDCFQSCRPFSVMDVAGWTPCPPTLLPRSVSGLFCFAACFLLSRNSLPVFFSFYCEKTLGLQGRNVGLIHGKSNLISR